MDDSVFDGDELLVLARVDLKAGTVDRALARLKRAVAQDDALLEAKLELARLYAQLGMRDRAAPLFEAYLALSGHDVDAHFQLGMVMFEQGDTQGASERWATVLQQSAKYPPALFFSALVEFNAGRRDAALVFLRDALKSIPADNLYFSRCKDLLSAIEAGAAPEAESRIISADKAYRTQH